MDSASYSRLSPQKPEAAPPKYRFHGGRTLDQWCSRTWKNGVQIETFSELDTLAVKTRNSLYEITVLSGATNEVMVRGGRFFPERTVARLAGSSLGGSFLKVGGIYPGFSLEFQTAKRRIVTSRVESVALP